MSFVPDSYILGQLLNEARQYLQKVFQDDPLASPALDARLLIASAANIAPHTFFTEPDQRLEDGTRAVIADYITRRGQREPVARILGEKEFWGLSFELSQETLIPRPETEGVIEHVLNWADKRGLRSAPLRVVDLGTGSGAVLIALLTALPNAIGFASDISEGALQTAWRNAIRHDVQERFYPVCCDFGSALNGTFDVIVSNPPYIRLVDRFLLADDVRCFDPERALYGGRDGLSAYRKILPWSSENLTVDGLGIVEHGYDQYDDVAQLALENGFLRTECVLDMAKLPRFCCFVEKVADLDKENDGIQIIYLE